MANSPTLKAQHADLLDARFREIYDNVYKLAPTYYDKLYQVINSSRSYELFSSESGLDYPVETPEYGQISEDGMIQGFDVTFTNRKFSRKAIVSQEALDDDLFGKLDKQAAALAKVFANHPDYMSADMLKRGFVTTDSEGNSMVAADGLRHFSTIHSKNPDETGTTYSNASATGLTFSEDNLETGMIAVEEQLNERGQLMDIQANCLVVPPALKKAALIATGSDKRADTADNDINVYNSPMMEMYYGGKLKVVVWKQLGASARNGSNTAWFLLDKNNHQMNFQWRERPVIEGPIYDEDRRAQKWVANMRYEFGMVDWRGTWGSKGDSAAYSS